MQGVAGNITAELGSLTWVRCYTASVRQCLYNGSITGALAPCRQGCRRGMDNLSDSGGLALYRDPSIHTIIKWYNVRGWGGQRWHSVSGSRISSCCSACRCHGEGVGARPWKCSCKLSLWASSYISCVINYQHPLIKWSLLRTWMCCLIIQLTEGWFATGLWGWTDWFSAVMRNIDMFIEMENRGNHLNPRWGGSNARGWEESLSDFCLYRGVCIFSRNMHTDKYIETPPSYPRQNKAGKHLGSVLQKKHNLLDVKQQI